MKNDYLLPLMKESGLFRVGLDGSVWTCKKRGGANLFGEWRRAEIKSGPRGRLQVRYKNTKMVYAARLVWFWFNGDIPIDHEIDHEDNDVTNTHPDNLQPLTRLSNQRKAEADGLIKRYPTENRKRGTKLWWEREGTKELMSIAAKRGWEKRKRHGKQISKFS